MFPTEILALIISYTIELEVQSAPFPPTITCVASVYLQWREIALSIPDFWAKLVNAPPNYLQLCISRSQSVPLHIYYTIPATLEGNCYQLYRRCFEIVARHHTRIMTLDVTGPPNFIEAHVAHYLQHVGHPQLRRLRVAATSPYQYMASILYAPQLEEIELHNVELSFSRTLDIVPFISLRRICLFSLSNPRVTLSRLITLVGYCYNLEFLEIEDSIGLFCNSYSNDLSLKLPNLKQLIIRDTISSIERLLSFLDLPTQTQITIECRTQIGTHAYSHLIEYRCASVLLAKIEEWLERRVIRRSLQTSLIEFTYRDRAMRIRVYESKAGHERLPDTSHAFDITVVYPHLSQEHFPDTATQLLRGFPIMAFPNVIVVNERSDPLEAFRNRHRPHRTCHYLRRDAQISCRKLE